MAFGDWWTPWQVGALALVCFLAVFQFGQVFTRLSPYDEDMHLGYALFVSDVELPPRGAIYPNEVFEEWACRGFHDVSQTTAVPECGLDQYDPNQFPGLGQFRSSSPPLYYVVVAATSAVPRLLVGEGPLGVMRLTGSLFLFAAIVGALESARLLGSDKRWAFATLISISMASRFIMLQTSTVTNDAAVFALGGVLLAAALRYTTGANRAWLPILIAVMAGLTKETAAFPTMAVAGLIVLDATSKRPLTERLQTAAVMTMSGFGLPFAWGRLVSYRTPDDWTSPIGRGNAQDVEGAPWDEIFYDPFGFIPPLPARGIPSTTGLDSTLLGNWGIAIGALILVAVGAAAVGSRSRLSRVAWSLMLSSVAASILLQGFLVLGRSGFFRGLSPRYGIGFIPIALVLVVLLFQQTRALRILGAAAIAASAVMMLYSFTTYS